MVVVDMAEAVDPQTDKGGARGDNQAGIKYIQPQETNKCKPASLTLRNTPQRKHNDNIENERPATNRS